MSKETKVKIVAVIIVLLFIGTALIAALQGS